MSPIEKILNLGETVAMPLTKLLLLLSSHYYGIQLRYNISIHGKTKQFSNQSKD